jgi:hypothetical protein
MLLPRREGTGPRSGSIYSSGDCNTLKQTGNLLATLKSHANYHYHFCCFCTAAAAPLVTFEPPYAVIHVYDQTGKVIETHEHAGEFKEWVSLLFSV